MDLQQAGEICGKTFSRYAVGGTEITLACMASPDTSAGLTREVVRALGVRELVLLDYQQAELDTDSPRAALVDLMLAIRPHVVVSGAASEPLKAAATQAFLAARERQGSSALPAKLYYRSGSLPVAELTTAIGIEGGGPELFARAYPRPWVTGILERDLFSGLPAPASDLEPSAA